MVMFPWERLVTLHRNPPTDKISRNQQIQLKYEKFMNDIKEKNINLNDYIYERFLNKVNVNFIENTFPYDIEDNCYHYVIWFDNEYFKKVTSSINENKIIDNIVRSKFKNNEYIYFENISGNKSVAKIKHFHVFIKN